MGMNIKNPEAHELALEISKKTGETITGTVIRALRELKAREDEKRKLTPEEKRARWEEIERKYPIPKGVKPPSDDEYYDEFGLPIR